MVRSAADHARLLTAGPSEPATYRAGLTAALNEGKKGSY